VWDVLIKLNYFLPLISLQVEEHEDGMRQKANFYKAAKKASIVECFSPQKLI
jgi:hypothetical protein